MTAKPLIANELLAFIQNAIDTMDEVSIMQICKSNFKEEDICRGKALVFEALGKLDVMPSRRRDGGEKSVQDIITLFKSTDPDDVPDFVAKELHKLPPVTFDHVDVTRLLKDITNLKASLVEVKMKLEESQTTISDLRSEVASLRATSVTRSHAASSINTQRGAQNMSASSFQSAILDATPVAADNITAETLRSPRPLPASPHEEPTRALAPVPPRAYATVAATAAAAANCAAAAACPQPAARPKRRRKKKKMSCEPSCVPAPEPASGKGPCDSDGFIRVVRRKPSSRNRCGVGPLDITSGFRAEVPTTQLYISRVHYAVQTKAVEDYLKTKTGLSLRVEKLDSRHNLSFCSFMVRVPSQHLSTYLSEEFWPKGVKFRRFTGRLQGDTAVHRRQLTP